MRLDELFGITKGKIANILLKECQPFLSQSKGLVAWHGQKHTLKDFYKHPFPANRNPVDTPSQIHDHFVQKMKEAGIKARRDNSVFATGKMTKATYFGPPSGKIWGIFPIGEFHFSTIPGMVDLYSFVTLSQSSSLGGNISEADLDSIISKVKEDDGHLSRYLLGPIGPDFSEILLTGSSYYGVSKKVLLEIKDELGLRDEAFGDKSPWSKA